jgi:propanol-preferring alcohol dehydrogenase
MENYCELQPGANILSGGLGVDGGMAPYMLVPSARFLVPLGDLDPVNAAPLTDAGLTPYHAIKPSLHRLVPGSSAVAIGVGGLGHLGVQILRALSPTRIIAVDTRDEALALAKQAGADVVVKAGETAVAEIREATKGKRADLVLDFVGVDASMAMAARVARPLGDVVIVGIGGGAFRLSFFSSNYEVSYRTTYWGTVPELHEVLALAESGRLRPHVERFSLDDGPEVYERLAAGLVRGRAVVTPG